MMWNIRWPGCIATISSTATDEKKHNFFVAQIYKSEKMRPNSFNFFQRTKFRLFSSTAVDVTTSCTDTMLPVFRIIENIWIVDN